MFFWFLFIYSILHNRTELSDDESEEEEKGTKIARSIQRTSQTSLENTAYKTGIAKIE